MSWSPSGRLSAPNVSLLALLLLAGFGCTSGADQNVINTEPEASISSPAEGQTFKPNTPISLLGTVSDQQDRDPTKLKVAWTINGAASDGSGSVLESVPAAANGDGEVRSSVEGLREGTYTVTLEVTDSRKVTATAARGITILNHAPSCTITSVQPNTVDPQGEVVFIGKATDEDTDDPPPSLRVRIMDSAEPALYQVAQKPGSDGQWMVAATFVNPGIHAQIYALCTDAGGKEGQSGIVTVTVNACSPDDLDGDGVSPCQGDCDDTNTEVFAGNTEICGDSLDNDCDGSVDAGVDEDMDGYDFCEDDCNDADPFTYAGAAETCNGVDNDCDGDPKDGESDEDGDGFPPCQGDCDDMSPDSYPNAVEVCDKEDNNCDGQLPASEKDEDGDDFAICEGDCDDQNPSRSPGLPEQCDGGLDNDCNIDTVEDTSDADKDGYTACNDCNDSDPKIHPKASEGPDANGNGIPDCDLIDNDCDGVVDDGTDCRDDDEDGYNDLQGDCDDFAYYTHPGATERPDLQDNDCNGAIEGVLTLSSAHVRLEGDLPSGLVGSALSGGRNVNGDGVGAVNNADGLQDLVIGAYGYDAEYQPSQNRGAAFLLFGKNTGWSPLQDVDLVDYSILLKGDEASARAGFSVAMAGDVNGDGYGDFVVGVPFHSETGFNNLGRAFIIFGMAEGWGSTSLTAASLSAVEAITTPDASNTNLGYSVGGGADVNGDGLDDLLVGVPWTTQAVATGYVLVVPGRYGDWPPKVKPNHLCRIQGTSGRGLGWSAAIAGYTNADDIADIIVGSQYDVSTSAGSAFALLGDPSYQENIQFKIDTLSMREYFGTEPYDYVSDTVSGEVDLDNDGFDDMLVGRRNAATTTRLAHVVFGGETLPESGDIDVRASLRFTAGTDGMDGCPCTVQGIGDMNGDGLDDFAVATSRNDEAAIDAGKIYVFYGRASRSAWSSTFPADVPLDSADMVILGEREDDQAGAALASSDINGDGWMDLVIGAPHADKKQSDGTWLTNTGKVYVVFGYPPGRNPIPQD